MGGQKVQLTNSTMPSRTLPSSIRCFCFGLILIATISLQSESILAFSVGDSPQSFVLSHHQRVSECRSSRFAQTMSMSYNEEDDSSNCSNNEHDTSNTHNSKRYPGRKRAILRKYGKAIAISSTLLYGPMATMPSARRFTSTTAHASTTAKAAVPTRSDYNFKDFKDIKGKLSLAPGANVQEYEEVLAKVEVEGEEAIKDLKKESAAALTIGDTGEEGGVDTTSGSSEVATGRRAKRAQKKAQKKKKQSQVSEWESDEFGFGEDYDDEDDFDSGVLSLAGSSKGGGKTLPSKKSKSGGESGGSGGVVLTDKMAYNNYKAPMSKEEQTKAIKKIAFYSIFPVFVITTIRGQIKAWKERRWVKKGLALRDEEYKQYLEEKKKKKDGKGDDDGECLFLCVSSYFPSRPTLKLLTL